jgi:hypothetical protein
VADEEDPGNSGTMLTADMQKGLEDLVHEMKVVPEEWWINDAVYCVRREMEYSMKSRVGSMVPRHMRHALEQVRKYSPLHKNDTRRIVEEFLRLWRVEWASVMVQNGLNPRPFARGQLWGHWVHEAPRASAEGTGVAVSTWVPHELKEKLEDMLVTLKQTPPSLERQPPDSYSCAAWRPQLRNRSHIRRDSSCGTGYMS